MSVFSSLSGGRKAAGCMAVAGCLVMSASASAAVLFQDGFEGYSNGAITFPTPDAATSKWTQSQNTTNGTVAQSIINGGAAEGNQYLDWNYEPNQSNGPYDVIYSRTDWRTDSNKGVYSMSMRVRMGNKTLGNSGQITQTLYIWSRGSTAGKIGTYLGITAPLRSNNNRAVTYYDGSTLNTVGGTGTGAWPTDNWMNVTVTIDEINSKWGFNITQADGATSVASASGLAWHQAMGTFNQLELYASTVGNHDGINIGVDDVKISSVPEPATLGLLGLGGIMLLARRQKRH